MLELIKVGSHTNPNALAGAIANSIRQNGKTTVTAVGAQAVQQAIKGLGLARKFLFRDNLSLLFYVELEDYRKPVENTEAAPQEEVKEEAPVASEGETPVAAPVVEEPKTVTVFKVISAPLEAE